MSWRNSLGALLVAAALTVGCESGDESGDSPAKADTPAAIDARSTHPTPDAAAKRQRPKMPPEARRNSPPEGMTRSALAVGTMAPALDKIASTTGE